MNKQALKAKMVLHGDTGITLAEALGISRATLSAKINEKNGAGFNQGEISVIKNRYSLTPEEVDYIFFA